jgi:CheY-like chemotaxis protein
VRGTDISRILRPAVSSFPKRSDDDRSDPSVRILVADDYKEFRELVCLLLGKRRDSQIVGEASDGSEAVHKAVELKPDLIVLDIDLPTLNGIEAGDAALTRKSLENSPVPIEAVPLESLIPDDVVPEFEPPLV